MTEAADLTLDELRLKLAPDIAASAIFDGWSDAALVSASQIVNPTIGTVATATAICAAVADTRGMSHG